MPTRQAVLDRRIATLKAQLMALGDLRPGSLSEQYNVCGTAGCQCKADPPRKHGPYYQVSFTWQGRSTSQFVRREHVATVRRHLRNYERLRTLVEQWIAAGLGSRDCASPWPHHRPELARHAKSGARLPNGVLRARRSCSQLRMNTDAFIFRDRN